MDREFAVTKTVDSTGVVVLGLEGSLDEDTSRNWDAALRDVLASGQYKVVLDLSSLEYMSSAGIGTFIGYIGELRGKGGEIVFLKPPPDILELFELLGFTKMFEVMESREDAINALAGS